MKPAKHASTLLQCAYKLYSEGKMCDTVLQVEGREVAVHRLILVAYSSYFGALGEDCDNSLSLDLLNLEYGSVIILVNYMYTGVLEVGDSTLSNLKKAAVSLRMPDVLHIISEIEERENEIKKEENEKLQRENKIISSNEEDLDVKEEPKSDNESTKEQQRANAVNTTEETVKIRKKRAAATRKIPSRRRSARIPKIPPKTRTRRKTVPKKLKSPQRKGENDSETNQEQASEKTSKQDSDGESDAGESEDRELDASMDEFKSEDRENKRVKAHIIRTPPRPIKQFKQADGAYKCPEGDCDFTTMSDKSFKRHWRQHTGEKPYKCSDCNKEFADVKYIYEHLPTHSDEKPYSCSMCHQKFKTKKNLSRHINNHHKGEGQTFTCLMCNGKFNSKYGLNTHERSVHGLKPSTVCDYPGCNYAAPTPSELKKHQVKHIPREERAKIMCDICGSLFVSPKCLKSHLRFMHYGEPQNCPYCSYTTPAKHLLIGHCARVHKCTLEGVPVQPKFFCNMCDFKCYHRHEYKCHLLKHADDLPHKCTFCTFATHMKGTLVKHLRTHTKERPFSCKICGKTFTNHSSLAMHNRSHLGIKPHKCKLCEKAFASSSTLKEHMFSHQNISPFMCHICCYGCVRKNILRKHIITKHGQDSLPPDMVFKRGYPLLAGASQDDEEVTDDVQAQSETVPENPAIQQTIATQPAPIVREVQSGSLENIQQSTLVSSSGVVASSAEAQFVNNSTLNVATVSHHIPMDTEDRSQSRENTQPTVSMETINNPQAQPSVENTAASHPSVTNSMPGHLYNMVRHANQPDQSITANIQSGDSLHPAQPQPVTPLFSHSQQPVVNQPGYEFPGYLNNSQMSLIQQMYLQSYNTNNMQQQ